MGTYFAVFKIKTGHLLVYFHTFNFNFCCTGCKKVVDVSGSKFYIMIGRWEKIKVNFSGYVFNARIIFEKIFGFGFFGEVSFDVFRTNIEKVAAVC